ncbi:hypothetical protein AB0N05_37605 [Nocardia sp. NPDC051030]|uniref:hypothetical protein n=1 Tax=Nocardia sp. NPDC051030 TaxID=3155162 RepID=UPI0034225B13
MNALAAAPFTARVRFLYRALLSLVAEVLLWSWIPDRVRDRGGEWLRPIGAWVWAARWRRIVVRAIFIWHSAGALAWMATAPARADYSKGVKENPVFSWMEVKDSHGISIWRYFMSIDEGSAKNKSAMFFSPLIKIEYEIYRALAGFAIWVIGYALSFDWLQTIIGPVRTVGESITALMSQMPLTGTLLTAAAGIGGWWILRGRWATGVYEIVMAAAIAAAAVGVLSNPVERVAGDSGLIMQARDAGLELAAGIANNGNATGSSDQLVEKIKSQLADTLVRQPTQLLNFGQVIDTMPGADGQKCIQAWDKGHDDFEGNTKDTLKDNIRNCQGGGDNFWDSNGGNLKDFADNPGVIQMFAGLVLILGGGVLCIFGIALAAAMVMAACSALIQSLKAVVVLVLGVLSGGARNALWKTGANLAISLVIMVFGIVFTVAYMLVLQAFFNSQGDNLFKKFLFVDAILLVGVFQFRRGVKGLHAMADGLAARFGTRPGPAASSIARPSGAAMNPIQSAYYATHFAGKGIDLAMKGGRAAKTVGHAATVLGGAGAAGAAVVGTGGLAAAVVVGKGAWSAAKAAKHTLVGRNGSGGGGSSAPPPEKTKVHPSALGAGGGQKKTSAGIQQPVATAAPMAMISKSRDPVATPSGISGTYHEYQVNGGKSLVLPTPRPSRPPKTPATASEPDAAASPGAVHVEMSKATAASSAGADSGSTAAPSSIAAEPGSAAP